MTMIFRVAVTVIGLGLLLLVSPPSATALVAAHLNFNGCNTCHNLHGGPSISGALLSDLTPEATCLSCHGPLGIATEAVIHGTSGQISCLECHNPHTNGDDLSTPARLNLDGTYNIKLIGLEHDANDSGPPPIPYLPTPQVREETIGGLGVLKDVVFAGSPADWGRADLLGICNTCHGVNHHPGEDCTACHSHSNGFAGTGCTGCHDGSGAGALAVSSASPHSETATGFTCQECHIGHAAGTIEIPNNTKVGINYGANGENGIALGSATVLGGTEAEICWNCHALQGVSEWDTNTQGATGSSPYNYGSLDQDDWTTAVWSSANFSYKAGSIQSTHSVNDSAADPGLDPVANIRCSYCHDVHELALAPHDTAAGKPYLRGTWMGNPYREDGAPSNMAGGKPGDIADYTAHDVTGAFGGVPRGGPNYTDLGGYFIDQNSGNPTSNPTMDSPDEFAGLCRLCHEGTSGVPGDGLWQSTEIAALNRFGAPGDDWVASGNSHGAVVKGGSSAAAFNLFTSNKRHQTAWAAYASNGNQKGNPVMAYRNARSFNKGAWETALWAQGLRGTDTTAFQYSPRVDTAIRKMNYGNYSWGATVVTENADGTLTDSGIDTNFHQFTCSKCYNPHASRLPRLLLTNCLDTRHNTWDNAYVTANDTALAVENRSVSLSQTTSAQNCHRLADPNFPQARPQGTATGGWNKVTPW